MNRLKSFFSHRWFTRYVWFYLTIVLASGIAFWAGMKYEQSKASALLEDSASLNTEVPSWIEELDQSDGKTLGDPDAPVKVVEYMDIECPFCKRFSRTVFPKLVRDYVKTGKVYYEIKHFPLPERVHPNAMSGAIAAQCAANQDRFWAYKNLAMKNRKQQSDETFLALAEAVSMPEPERFVRCFKQRKESRLVKRELQQGIDAGVNGTPTVVIGDETISGVRSYSRYRKALEAALESASSAS